MQEHASAINNLYDKVFTTRTGVQVVINSVAETPVRVTDGQFYGEVVKVVTGQHVDAGSSETWSVEFTSPFADIPVVTATLIAPESSTRQVAAQEAVVEITSVSSSMVSGIVSFPKEGSSVTLQVSVLAIGVATI